MNFSETLRGLLRRWYITFPGILVAIAVALGAWVAIPPSYERTATQLLLPGNGNIPANSNPLLYLGGLSFAADVLVRAVGSESTLNAIKKDHPDAQVTVTRDDTSGGPFIIVTVDAPTDAEAGVIVADFIDRTASQLETLQVNQNIPLKYRISVVPVSEDDKGTLQQRNRLVATVGGGVVVLALSLLLAGLVDGLSRRRRLGTVDDPDDADDGTDTPGTADVGAGRSAAITTATASERQPAGRLARNIQRKRGGLTTDRSGEEPAAAHRSP
jgi:hypothetical protein